MIKNDPEVMERTSRFSSLTKVRQGSQNVAEVILGKSQDQLKSAHCASYDAVILQRTL